MSTPTHQTGSRTPNRLIHETSPYLLQHAYNPVDWYPWGETALALARQSDRPIMLSIGYSACHWCHVMERESFEDDATARLMNSLYVNIKVDREERPDLDSVYMQAVQSLTGHGGWPMTVFLLPDGTPFYGGTYFPPERRHGMPAFRDVLTSVANAYRTQRADVLQSGKQLREMIAPANLAPADALGLSLDVLRAAESAYAKTFDDVEGGFGRAPKFPQPANLEALLRIWRHTAIPATLQMATLTLDRMAQGGMYDHLGGGFHRYSVDAVWLVPHFEKMLYDNAQLARVYLASWQATGNAFHRDVCREILDYVLREMTAPDGGFHATQDADSEGIEGKFFVWTPAEVAEVVGEDDARVVCAWFDVTDRGNFEHKNILRTARDREVVAKELGITVAQLDSTITRVRETLYQARESRVKPSRDDKVIVAWNGLMIRAFAEAGAVLEDANYLDAARHASEFILNTMAFAGDESDPSGEFRLHRTFKDAQSRVNAFLEDYACLGAGLLALYEATGEVRWFLASQACASTIMKHFRDTEHGGFFDTSDFHETLVTRPKDLYDNAVPSGSSVACELILRLAAFTGDDTDATVARDLLARLAKPMATHPGAFGHLLCALDIAVAKPVQVAIIGTDDDPGATSLIREVHRVYCPNRIIGIARGDMDVVIAAEIVPLLAERIAIGNRPTAYVCEQFSCQLPTNDPRELAYQLAK
jgi:uncharacterized protein YyaL (SSP411 family)